MTRRTVWGRIALAAAVLTGWSVLVGFGCGESGVLSQEMPDAPIPDRFQSTGTWTGTEVIYWGGRSHVRTDTPHVDGAAYNPTTRTWRTIAPAPLSARFRHNAAWSGSEMLIWGGETDRVIDGNSFAIDGAAYHVATNTWRLLPEPGPDLAARDGRPFRASSPALVIGDRFFAAATSSVLSLHLMTGEWRRIDVEVPGFRTDYSSSSLKVHDGQLYLTARADPPGPKALEYRGDALVIATLDPVTGDVLDVEVVADVRTTASLVSTDHGLTLLVEDNNGIAVLTNQEGGWKQVEMLTMNGFGRNLWTIASPVVETGHWLVGVESRRLQLIDRASLDPASIRIGYDVGCRLGPSPIWTGSHLVGWNSSMCFQFNRPTAGGVVVTLPEPAR